jgi:drug/metabolite transporter (DMT)-like permease
MTSSGSRLWRANAILLLTAAIWGLGFVAQRLGATGLGPFSYNSLRFALGAAALVVALPLVRRIEPAIPSSRRMVFLAGLACGAVLFTGTSLQTAGLQYTLPGKAGFITGLYVVIVPILGLFWRQKSGLMGWLGAMLAVGGLYFLSVGDDVGIQTGDLLILSGAFFWAVHVWVIAYFSRRVDPIRMAVSQFAVTALLSLAAGLIFETPTFQGVRDTLPAILFGGLLSVGVAFTLQVIGQKDTHPGHAAIIMVSEAMFAVLGGWLLLGERLGARELFGCALMLAGMIFAVIAPFVRPLGENSPQVAPAGENQVVTALRSSENG